MKYTKCIIDVCIILVTFLFCLMIYLQFHEIYIKYICVSAGVLFAVFWGLRLRLDIKILALKLVKNPQKGTITELALLSEEGKPIKTWGIYGKISLIIGKNTMKSHADVDLKNTAFSSLVDPEHAVLNYADNNWYLEDNDSRNGISIVKNGDKKRYYISKREPVIIEMGDIVYIANTRLLVR